ncbi:MAG: LacI family DNA-binding transcriptional regulator [Terrimicrobiaceae bacterium]|nr:LacI family DNA-binding transcriptional regulator [Terrimicrobiaceae bacterium]
MMERMAKMTNRASMQDIAAALKVDVSTVSLALRDDSRISRATRERVKAEAERQGYKSNPLVNAWLRQVRKPGTAQAGVGIAFLLGLNVSAAVQAEPYYKILIEGARAEAGNLGYVVTEILFGLDDERHLLKAVSQLRYRGVRGVMIFDPEEKIPEAVVTDLEKDFAVVVLLRAGDRGRFHFVGTNIGQNTMLALARLRERGCRRIALTLHPSQALRLRKFVMLNYLGEQQSWPENERVPLPDRVIEHDPKKFLAWIRKVRPDAILSVNYALYVVLREAGYRMPGDLVFAHIGTDARPELTGVNNRAFEIGRSAVFKLAGLITENRYGIPEIPLMTLVPGVWAEPDDPGSPPLANKTQAETTRG